MSVYLPNGQTYVKGNFAYLALESEDLPPQHIAMQANDEKSVDGALIRQARKGLKMSLETLAEKVGLSVGYVSRMERGGRNISLKNLQKLSSALKVPASTLVLDQDTGGPLAVAIVSWVSAGKPITPENQDDRLGTIRVGELDPRGEWVALRVEGDSMDRISPHGSVILVNRRDTRLVPNACYVIGNGEEEVTYKRWRSNPNRFEPVSTNPAHEPIYYSQEPRIIGRVKKTVLDM